MTRASSMLLAAVVVVLVGCGGSDDDRSGSPQSSSAAALLAPRDLERQPEGSAERAVMELWFWGQWGNAPEIVGMHDPRILDALGFSYVAGGYASRRHELLRAKPEITFTRRTRYGTVVGVRPSDGEGQESFLLREVDGEWRVLFDTVLERGLNEYVQSLDQSAEGRPTVAAVEDARRKASDYRTAVFCAGRERCRLPDDLPIG